jgi:hypothetical protein
MPIVDRATNLLAQSEAEVISAKPIFFVTHSLGGLIVKEMLRTADTLGRPAWKEIVRQTRGIVFLATPHRGSGTADFFKALGSILRISVSVRELEANAAYLRGLNLWYQNNVSRLRIESSVLFETQNTLGVRVVNEASADPGIPGVIPIPIDSDHFGICKPLREDLVYKTTSQFIGRLLEDETALDPGSHHGLLHYEDGDEGDITPTRNLKVDRMRDYQRRKKRRSDGCLEIARIDVRSEDCLWYGLPGLSGDMIHRPEHFMDKEVGHLYTLAKYFFHQSPGDKKNKFRVPDPILDLIVVNNSNKTLVIKTLSVAALAVWTIGKAIPIPKIIRPMAAYAIKVDFEKRFSTLSFDEPLFLEHGGVWRFFLRLVEFNSSVGAFGNESLISLRFEDNISFTESEPIYFGIVI